VIKYKYGGWRRPGNGGWYWGNVKIRWGFTRYTQCTYFGRPAWCGSGQDSESFETIYGEQVLRSNYQEVGLQAQPFVVEFPPNTGGRYLTREVNAAGDSWEAQDNYQGTHNSCTFSAAEGWPAPFSCAFVIGPVYELYDYNDYYPPDITSPSAGVSKVGTRFFTSQTTTSASAASNECRYVYRDGLLILEDASSFDIVYSIQSNPSWVKCDQNGLVKAIPPLVGTFTWILRASRSGVPNAFSSQTFTLTVNNPDTPVDQVPLMEFPLFYFDGSIYIDPVTGEPFPSGFIPLSEEFMYVEIVDGNENSYDPKKWQPIPFNLEAKSYFITSPVVTGFTLNSSRFTKSNHGFKNGTSIVFVKLNSAGSQNPRNGALYRNYRYYVIDANTNSFGVSILDPVVFPDAASIEILIPYSGIEICIFEPNGNNYSGDSPYFSPPTPLALPWTNWQSSNIDYASLSGSGNIRTVSFPRATDTFGNPPVPVGYVEPKEVRVSTSQAGNSVYNPAQASLTWGDDTVEYDPNLHDHFLSFTMPETVGLGQEVAFTVISNKNLSPIIVRSRAPDIALITGGAVSNGQITWTPSCKIKGISYGNAIIEAEQAGNPNANPMIPQAYAATVITVSKKSQTITLNVPSITLEEGMELSVSATSDSGLPVSLSTTNANVAFFNGNILAILGQGSSTIVAYQAGNDEWAPAIKTQNIGVGSSRQFISFSDFGVVRFGDPDFAINAFSTSGLPLSFTSNFLAVASISGEILKINGVGLATITANQPGDAYWKPADPVSKVLEVLKGIPTITANVPSSIKIGPGYRIELTGVSSSGASVQFSAGGTSLRIVQEGSKYFLEGLSEATGAVFASVASTNLYEAASLRFQVRVGRQDQAIVGESFYIRKFSDLFLELNHVSNFDSSLPISVSVISGPGSSSGKKVVFTAAGVIELKLSQPGNAEFRPAPDFYITIVVEKGIQTVSFLPISKSPMLLGDFAPLPATASGGGTVFFYSSSPSLVKIHTNQGVVGALRGDRTWDIDGKIYTVFILVIAPGDSNYEAAAAVQPFSIIASFTGLPNIAIAQGANDEEEFNSKLVSPGGLSSECKLVPSLPPPPWQEPIPNAIQAVNYAPVGFKFATLPAGKRIYFALINYQAAANVSPGAEIDVIRGGELVKKIPFNIAAREDIISPFPFDGASIDPGVGLPFMIRNTWGVDVDIVAAGGIPGFPGIYFDDSVAIKIVDDPTDYEIPPFRGLENSPPTSTPDFGVSGITKDEEVFNSRAQSNSFTGVCFLLDDYPGRGDAEVAFLSINNSPPHTQVSTQVATSTPDSESYDSFTSSPPLTGNCVIARYDGSELVEPYNAAPELQPNGFILTLSGTATPCVSNWTDWLPLPNTVCAGDIFVQTRVDLNGCQNVLERTAVGTKVCSPPNCVPTWSDWSPSRATVCSGQEFSQQRLDLNGCQNPQTRINTGLNVCIQQYAFVVEVVAIPAPTRPGTIQSPPCPRVNTWGVGASPFYTTPGVYTSVYTTTGPAGVDIFTWVGDQTVEWYSFDGSPEVIYEVGGNATFLQEKLQLRYSQPGSYRISVKIIPTNNPITGE
jgi:hypothetical protein